MRVAPLWINCSCSPSWQRPVSARCMISAPDSVSWSWATSTSSGPMPACSKAAAAASAVGETPSCTGIDGLKTSKEPKRRVLNTAERR